MRIASMVFVLMAVCSFASAQEWAGTYTTTISPADVPPEMAAAAGSWELILGEEGQFTSTQNGEVVVRGTYAVSGDQMAFSDAEGKMACAKEQASGSYKPALDGGTLSFTLVDDQCAGRRIVLTSHALTKKKTAD
ncbi:hypothetical protein L0222_25160 [bacterium]|nr:hypothetical protein [bacterium]MCI0606255.1 hypothetical protein [bacterium]